MPKRIAPILAVLALLLLPATAGAHERAPTIQQARTVLLARWGRTSKILSCTRHTTYVACHMRLWTETTGPIEPEAIDYNERVAWRGHMLVAWEP